MTIPVGQLRSNKCFRAACIRGLKGFLLFFVAQSKIMNCPYIHDEAIKEHGHGQPGQLQHL